MEYKIFNDVLNATELNDLKVIINSPNAQWEEAHETVSGYDGRSTTAEDMVGFKNCESLRQYNETTPLIFGAIDRCSDWIDFVMADDSGTPLITRTPTGGYYRPHQDASKNGEFSTTIFLNNPDEYEGGELQLDFNGDIQNVKLPAGSAITYRTGIPHCVNDVTKGHRDVAVFWTRTLFKDPYDLMLIRGIKKAMQLLECKQCANLEEAREDPYFILATLMHNIERKNLLKNNDNS